MDEKHDGPTAISVEKASTERVEVRVPEGSDDALYQRFSGATSEWHASMRKKLLWKVDLHLLPMLILMYLLNFLDRNNLAQARLDTLEADLGMAGTDYNLATSILFVGYLLMQLPSNLLLTRVKPALYIGGAMVGTFALPEPVGTSVG